ncbi:DUF7547 family protein [Haloglomus litoreum]|uniref:DUF7547 family protein n=1 Tax=Haloglomus litoreum TaxID=3034026 RepID=UPI0023E8BFE0|nr:hypothetical protein [Haloglomus sp. DT116]
MSDWDAGGESIPVQVISSVEGGQRRGPHRSGQRDDDLAALVTELEETLRDLRTAVEGDTRQVEPPGARGDGPALPRPPSPRELLRFTETYTIPTVVAFLEAAIRGLELLAGTIRLLDGRDPRSPGRRDDGRGVLADVSTAAGERAAAGGREALARVDDALAELQRTYEGEPEDPTARRLLADARELRGEIDDRLSAIERDAEAGGGREEGAGGARRNDDRGPSVDVDAELASLKERADRGDDGENDPGDGDDAPRGDGGER